MNPFFSIITPSLQRQSLIDCCHSVEEQDFNDWDHIIQIDCTQEDINAELLFSLAHPQRRFFWCGKRHNNYGNSCRNLAWKQATGMWVHFLDDDNALCNYKALSDLAAALKNVEYWAIAPIIRHGRRFFYDPPGNCYVDTANMIIKKEIAQWPDIPDYTADGIFCEELKSKYPYSAFPDMEPIVIMEKSNKGRP